MDYLQNGNFPPRMSTQRQHEYEQELDDFQINLQGQIVYEPKGLIVIPPDQRDAKMKEEYDKPEMWSTGVEKFYQYMNSKYIGITKSDTKQFLHRQPVFQLNYDRKNVTNKLIIAKRFGHFQIDHIHLKEAYAPQNQGYRYIFTCIDFYTKKLYLRPQRQLTATETKDAFNDILQHDVPPLECHHVQSDNGTSFLEQFHENLRNKNITHIFGQTYNPTQQAFVENANKYIRRSLNELSLRNGNHQWVNLLPTVSQRWNNAKHTHQSYTPQEIVETLETMANNVIPHNNLEDEDADMYFSIRNSLRDESQRHLAKNKSKELELHDWVRVSTYQMDTEVRRAYKEGRSKDVIVKYTPMKYRIIKVIQHPYSKNEYIIEDQLGFPVLKNTHPRRFFASDLLKTTPPDQTTAQPPSDILNQYTNTPDAPLPTPQQQGNVIGNAGPPSQNTRSQLQPVAHRTRSRTR
jgi:hypothetical protein